MSRGQIYRAPRGKAASPPRATARVPTPLHTAPALTMIRRELRSFRYHSKGGGGVERGGDPCGRPGGTRRSLLPLLSETWSTTTKKCQAGPLLFVFGTLYFIFQYLRSSVVTVLFDTSVRPSIQCSGAKRTDWS